jgi:hypothetical protein
MSDPPGTVARESRSVGRELLSTGVTTRDVVDRQIDMSRRIAR